MRATPRIAALLAVAGVAIAAAAVPAGCFFPNYTFDKNGNGGGGTGPGTGPSMTNSGGTSPSTGTQNGGGGMTSSSSGVGGVPCGTDGRCIADVPTGWNGYFALYDGPNNDPGCPSDFPSTTTMPFLGQGDFSDGGDATCKCTCKAPTGEVCSYPTEIDVQPGTCANSVCGYILAVPTNWNGTCAGMDYVPKDMCTNDSTCMGTSKCSGSIHIPPATVDESAGSCQPNAVKVVKVDASFGSLGRGCGDPKPIAGSCNGGQACMPVPPAPFLGGLCVMQTGDVMCPPIFSKKHVFYDSLNDDRDCSGQCACPGKPSGATCSATITLYQDLTIGTCSTQVPGTPVTTGTCADLNVDVNVAGRTATPLTPPTGGTCAGDNSATMVTGSADPVGPTTFCCVPPRAAYRACLAEPAHGDERRRVALQPLAR